jgi:MFS family permease
MNLSLSLSIAQIGLITTAFTTSRIIGSIGLGSLSDYINRQKLLLIIVLLSMCSSGSLIFSSNWVDLTLLYAINGVLNGGLFSILLAQSMDITNAKMGALQFSILISLMNAGELTGELISGSLITFLGFTRVFLFASWILGPSLLFLYAIIKTEPTLIKNK